MFNVAKKSPSTANQYGKSVVPDIQDRHKSVPPHQRFVAFSKVLGQTGAGPRVWIIEGTGSDEAEAREDLVRNIVMFKEEGTPCATSTPANTARSGSKTTSPPSGKRKPATPATAQLQ